MDSENAIKILRWQLWKVGKSNGEQLWTHEYTVWYIFRRLMENKVFPPLDEEKMELLEVSCLLHDMKKATPWNQEILKGDRDPEKLSTIYKEWWGIRGIELDENEVNSIHSVFKRGKTDHQIESKRDKEYILIPYLRQLKKDNLITFELTDANIDAVFDIIKHHFITESDVIESNLPNFGSYILLLKYCDHLASMEQINVSTLNELRKINKIGRKIFDLTYVTVSREFTPSTCLIINNIIETYKNMKWSPLLIYEDGCVFIGKNVELPDKKSVVDATFGEFLRESINQHPLTLGTKKIFVGTSADHPKQYLQLHADNLVELLNKSNGAIVFFKIAAEIFELAGYKNKKIRTECPVLDVLFSLTSGNRGIPQAGEKWQNLRGENLPVKEDGKIDKGEAIEHIFNTTYVNELIPNSIKEKFIFDSKRLKDCTSKELYNLLINFADLIESESEQDANLKEYLNEIVSLEESADFKKIAFERFEAYKRYKSNPQKSNGVCEICGCTITQKPGSDFANGQIQAFSQIKANPTIPRQVCPLCAYDNSKLRNEISGKDVTINLKVYSKIPPAFENNTWRYLIKPLKDGLANPQFLVDMGESSGIPFPRVPILVPNSKLEIKEDPEIREISASVAGNETIFRLEKKKSNEFSPKDSRVQYRPLYHLLNLLGFKVSLGAGEQEGLFGEKEFVSEANYQKSLATVILASCTNKNQKRFIFAESLLINSPSTAIRFAVEKRKNSNDFKMKEEFAISFFDFLYGSDVKCYQINGRVYTMKDLLEDAKFFSEGISKYCDWDWKKWKQSPSKYMASKPVTQALNEILQGRSFDIAFSKFLSNLRDNISSDKTKSDKATVDVNDLSEFVAEAEERLKKYYYLREEDISSFIRAKNALTTTIFVFTRYSKLKEVVN